MNYETHPVIEPILFLLKRALLVLAVAVAAGIWKFSDYIVEDSRAQTTIIMADGEFANASNSNVININDILEMGTVAQFNIIVNNIEKDVVVKKKMNNKDFTLHYYTENKKNKYYFRQDEGINNVLNIFGDEMTGEQQQVQLALVNGKSGIKNSDTFYYIAQCETKNIADECKTWTPPSYNY